MRKIFIDCGGHQATSVDAFLRRYPAAEQFEIYSFEANHKFAAAFEKFSNVNLDIAAVWIHDGSIKFHNTNDESSSIYEEKVNQSDIIEELEVKSIDLDRWIKENFDKDDYIVLKLDIEGAEYEVLEHMMKNGSIEWIDRLFIEWHCAKIDEITVDRHITLLEALYICNLPPRVWDHSRDISFNEFETLIKNIARTPEQLRELSLHGKRFESVCAKFSELDLYGEMQVKN